LDIVIRLEAAVTELAKPINELTQKIDELLLLSRKNVDERGEREDFTTINTAFPMKNLNEFEEMNEKVALDKSFRTLLVGFHISL